METSELVRLLDLLEGAGARVSLHGGLGVDALLGEEVREHDDPDLVCLLGTPFGINALLGEAGYELTEKDYRELRLLHERFGVALPAHVVARALGPRAG